MARMDHQQQQQDVNQDQLPGQAVGDISLWRSDQIGRFLKVFCKKYFYKSGPNIY